MSTQLSLKRDFRKDIKEDILCSQRNSALGNLQTLHATDSAFSPSTISESFQE